MSLSPSTIAATATIAALGILAAVALASGGEESPAPPAPAAETDPPVEVRTQTIRRTVHKRAKAKPVAASDDGTADQGPGDAPAVRVAPAAGATGSAAGPANTGQVRGGDDDFGDHSGRGGDDDFDDHSGPGGGDDDFDEVDDDDDGGHGRGRGRGRGGDDD